MMVVVGKGMCEMCEEAAADDDEGRRAREKCLSVLLLWLELLMV